MSDRLNELLRQRAAIKAHLDWLDREITQASPSAALAPSNIAPVTVPETSTPATTAVTKQGAAAVDADVILAGYQQDTRNLRSDVRKGCLIYFFGAFLLLGLGIASFYFVNRLIHRQSDPAPQAHDIPPEIER